MTFDKYLVILFATRGQYYESFWSWFTDFHTKLRLLD